MKYISLILVLFLFACGDSNSSSDEWTIPSSEVFDGGPGKDGIPSVDDPEFDSVTNTDYLDENDLVVGVIVNGTAKVYPHPILDWHEIVNDNISSQSFALTYCPLTGTALAWDRNVNGSETTFGVSGKLYNSNLMPYDRESDSYWSQLGLESVNGELVGTPANVFPLIETTWATWKAAYPNAQVMTTNTGFSRNYNQYPYGDFRTNHNNLIFPVSPFDNRLPAKERVFAALSTSTNRVYSIELFEDAQLIQDNIDSQEIMIIGSKADNFMVGFNNPGLEGLSYVANALPVIAEDQDGNRITLSGAITSGPMSGTQLTPLKSVIGYFFSLGAFYPGIEIYE